MSSIAQLPLTPNVLSRTIRAYVELQVIQVQSSQPPENTIQQYLFLSLDAMYGPDE